MHLSYLRMVTLYIHPFLELSLVQPCSVTIKLFFLALHTAKSCYLPFRRFTTLQSTHARSGRGETVSLEFKRACAPDFESHRSLPDM
jgi:hypothetical protein